MSMTAAQKVLARAAGKSSVRAGEYVDGRLDGIMAYQSFIETHMRAIEAGPSQRLAARVRSREAVSDGRALPASDQHQNAIAWREASRALAALRAQALLRYDCGICHQMMADNAHALPGELIIGTDSHAIMYGVLNCAATRIGETDTGYAITFGELWFRVPASVRIILTGAAPSWPIGKDVMLYLAGRYGVDFALYKSIRNPRY